MIGFCICSTILFASLLFAPAVETQNRISSYWIELAHSEPDPFLINHSASSSYNDLSCTESEWGHIYHIVTTVARNEWYYLLWIQNELLARGKKIEHMHPFKFLEVILSNQELKECLKQIRSSMVKWYRFQKDLKTSFLRQVAKNQLAPHVQEFCHIVGVDPAKVSSYVEKKKWDQLLDYLIYS